MRFNNMNFSDGHYVQIPTIWDAQEFTYRFLSATPPWVRTIMQVRNRVVQKIGFPDGADHDYYRSLAHRFNTQ